MPQDVRHDVRYVGVLPAWHVDFACHVCYVCELCAYDVASVHAWRSAFPRSVKGRQLPAVDTSFYRSVQFA